MSASIAFVAPHGDHFVLWATSPSGHFMLLAGFWHYAESARLYATSAGYRLIPTEAGMDMVEKQFEERAGESRRRSRMN